MLNQVMIDFQPNTPAVSIEMSGSAFGNLNMVLAGHYNVFDYRELLLVYVSNMFTQIHTNQHSKPLSLKVLHMHTKLHNVHLHVRLSKPIVTEASY